MCGIAGYVQRRPPPDGTIDRMTARLAHRGPDGSGIWHGLHGDWHVALGHRRLAIIDVAAGGQPLGNEDGSVQITYNGEVYNFRTLRHKLANQGHQFATRCDTEVIVHQYEQHGEAGLEALNGMFAFAIWDGRHGRLMLARDRIGIKPLYYAPLPDGGLAFASELTALLAHPGIDRSIDPEGLARYFFLDYVHPPNTLVRGARKLEPGHYLVWTRDGISPTRPYWHLRIPSGTHQEEHVLQALDAAVDSQLVSDVPLGVFLSGGIDSSIVAALAQRHRHEPIAAFSIGFEDADFDESGYARCAVRHIGARYVSQTLSEAGLLQLLDEALSCLDEPIADPSIVPTYALSKLAAQHVKVVLGGDGGDELWAGYPTYRAHRLAAIYRRIPRRVRASAIEPIVARLPVRQGYQSLEWKAKRFAQRWDDHAAVRHLRWMSNLDLPELGQALPGVRLDPPGLLGGCSGCHNGDLNAILALDLATYLPGSVLTKVDRAAMAHGLEVRPPMLDNRVIELAFSLPFSSKLRGRTSKAALKAAAARLLPEAIIHRPKQGFAIPLARWMNGSLQQRVDEVLRHSSIWDATPLNQPAFANWAVEHRRREADRSKPLWAMLVLNHWFQRLASL